MIKIMDLYDGKIEYLKGEVIDYDNWMATHFCVRDKNVDRVYSKAWYRVVDQNECWQNLCTKSGASNG